MFVCQEKKKDAISEQSDNTQIISPATEDYESQAKTAIVTYI